MKTNKFSKKLFAGIVAVAAFMLFSISAKAQTSYTWTGASTNPDPTLWSDATNWSQTGGSGIGQYPGDGLGGGSGNEDIVLIATTAGVNNPHLDVNVTIAGLEIGDQATLFFNGTTTMQVNGDVVMGAVNTYTSSDIDMSLGTTGGTDLVVNGNITGYGTLYLYGTGQSIAMTGNFEIGGFFSNDGADFGSTVIFNGTGTQTISPAAGGAYNFDNLEVDNNGTGATLSATLDIEVDGNLTGSGIVNTGTTEVDLVGDMTVHTFSVGANNELLFLFGVVGNLGNGGTSLVQNIDGQNFYNVHNLNSGTVLTGDVNILNNLDFEQGNWDLNTHDLIVVTGAGLTWNSGNNQPTEGDMNSFGYVITDDIGTLNMAVSTTKIGFPVGSSASELTPVTFNTTSGTGRLDVRVFQGVTDHAGVALSTTTKDAVNYEWVANPENTKLDYQVSTHWNSGTDELSSMTETGVFLSYRHQDPGTSGTPHAWTPLGLTTGGPTSDATNSTNNDADSIAAAATVSIGTDNPIGITYIATGSSPSSLPVSLLSFGAQYQNGQVNLNWTTASEQNNAYFEIERSTNAANWTAIGQVQGHGTTNVFNSYISTDNLAGVIPTGSLYYRLKQVDFNGKYTYSMIRSVDLSNPGPSVATYPNPTSNVLNVNWTSATDDNAVLRLVNMSGASVYEQSVSGKGLIQQKIDMSTLPAGVYYLQIISNNNSTVNQPVFKN